MPHDPLGIGLLCAAAILFLLRRKRRAVPLEDVSAEFLTSHIEPREPEEQWRRRADENVFRERIDQLVKEKQSRGYTVQSVCREIGVNPSTLSEWRRGEAFPTRKNMERVARYFGVSIQWLCSEDAEREYHDLLEETKNKA